MIYEEAKKHGVALKKLALLGPLTTEQAVEEIKKRSSTVLLKTSGTEATAPVGPSVPGSSWVEFIDQSPRATDLVTTDSCSVSTRTAVESYIPLPAGVYLPTTAKAGFH